MSKNLGQDYDTLAAQWGMLKIDLHHAERAVQAAERYCQCLAEFDAEGPRYCAEWLEALETALVKFREIEAVGKGSG